MDQIKIGAFIAQLRKERGLTQEALGEKLGVTNKTVSRWETGTYMPDVETLLLLSRIFQVSVNELLCGQRLDDRQFRARADENLVAVSRESAFDVKERLAFWKRKWVKNHLWLILLCLVVWLCLLALSLWRKLSFLAGVVPVLGLVLYIALRHKMMVYAENHVYGPIS